MIRYRVGPGAIAAAGEDDGRGDDGADAAREAADTSVSLTILDEDGEEIRTLEGPAEEGLHQVVWDLRHDPPYEPDDDGGGFFGSTRGPRVLPGRYAVRVEAGERSARTGIEVEGDPRVRVDRSELLARHGALMSLHRLAGPLHRAEETAEELSDRLDQVRSLLEERDPPAGELATEVETLAEEVDSLADELDDHSGDVRSLSFSIERVVQEPTAEQEWELDHTWERSREAIERFNELLRDDLPALSRRLADEGVLAPVAEPLEVPTPPGS